MDMETLRKLNFNGKIYGKKGAEYIFVNNVKVDVTEEQVLEYNSYIKEKETILSNFPEALNSREVQIKAVELGLSKEFVEKSLEQLKSYLNTFKVETVAQIEQNGATMKLEQVTYNNEVISGFMAISTGVKRHIPASHVKQMLDQIAKMPVK